MILTIEISVHRILEKSSGSEVDKFELKRLGVDKKVLVFDVPVDHPLPVACQHGLYNLKIEPCCKKVRRELCTLQILRLFVR